MVLGCITFAAHVDILVVVVVVVVVVVDVVFLSTFSVKHLPVWIVYCLPSNGAAVLICSPAAGRVSLATLAEGGECNQSQVFHEARPLVYFKGFI